MSSSPDRWRLIEELCQAALERDLRERSAFLATSCGEDDELRRDVESLLAREPRVEGFLDQRAREAMLHEMAGESRASMVGRRLGAYHVVGALGVGGMDI